VNEWNDETKERERTKKNLPKLGNTRQNSIVALLYSKFPLLSYDYEQEHDDDDNNDDDFCIEEL
jgi:hypothetical protein